VQGSTAKIYLNGVQQAQGTFPDPALSGTLENYLGKSQWAADPLFNGKLDDVTIADTAMTDAQIAALMANTLPPFTAHWKGDVDGNWNTNNAGNTNWATAAGGTTDAGQAPAANTVVSFSTGGSNSSNTTLGADFSIEGLNVTTSSAVGIGGVHNLTIGDNGIDITSGAGAMAINTSGQVTLGANQTWSNNSPAALTVNSVVSGGGTLNVGGSGLIALTAANTMTGEVVIYGGGSVSAPSIANSLGSASVVRMGGGGSAGALIYTGTGETTSRILTFNGGLGTPGMVLDQSGSGLLKFTANTATSASVSKTMTLQGSTSGTGEFAGIISNGGTTTSLAKAGTGTWTLSGANTYTGTTMLNAGVLAIGHNAAFGTGTLDLRGGTLQSSDATARTVANAISVSADTTFGGTGNLLFTGAVNAGSLTKTFIVNNARTEFSGVVSGSGARVKAGAGALVLGGANSYTGATTVSAGTLTVNGSLAAGSAVTVANGATLTGTGSVKGATAFANGSRLGWSLAANSGTSGKLSAAAVSVTKGAATNLVFNGAGSTVDFTDVFWTQSHLWQVLASTGMSGTFTLGTISSDSAGHTVAGNFFLQQNSTGVKLFYAPPGAQPPPTPMGLSVSVAPGGVTLSWNASLDAVGYNILRSIRSGGPYEIVATDVAGTSYADKSVSNGTTYYYVVVATSPNGESPPTAEIVATPHLPNMIDKAENTSILNQPGSWTGGIVPVSSDTARWTGLTGASSVTLGADAGWNGIVVGATGGPVSIGAGATLTLGKGGIDLSAATQNLTISSGLTISSVNQNWQVPSGRTLALSTGTFSRPLGATLNIQGSGVISSGTTNEGSTSILGPWATAGSGTATTYVTLSGGNLASFTAGTNVSSASFPNPSTTNDNYNLTTASTTTYGAASRSANTIRNTVGASTLTFGNSASQINLVTNGILNAGTGLLTVANGGTHVSSGIQIGPNNGRELVVNAANSSISLGRIIDGGGGASSVTVNTSGTNTVTLTTANTFTGGIQLNSGTLLAGSSSALGTGTFNLKGGTFGTTAALTIANPINVTGTNIVGYAAQAGDLTFSGALSGNGTLTNFTGSSAATNLFLTGNLSGFTGTLDYTCRTGTDTQFWRFGTNSATVDLSNAAVIVRAGNVTNLITVASKNFGFRDGISGATLKLGSLSGDGVVQASYNNAGPNTLEIGALNADTTFSGALAGGNSGTKLNLTKVGNGILTLTGTHPYSGTTAINGGTLMVNGLLTGNSAVTVNSGGTFAGSGISSGAVTITGGGAIAPGNSSGGVLTLSGALTLNDGSILNMAIGNESSRISLGGTFTAGGITTVNVSALAGFGAGTYPLITGAAGINASNFAVGTTPGGYTCTLSASSGTLSLTVEALLVAPAVLTAVDGNQSIALSWTPSSAAASYNVKRSITSGTGYTTIGSNVTATHYADTDLAVGTTYYYVVSAVKLGSESEDSSEASARALTASEAWREQKFGTTDNGGDAADGADPDKDGLTNLMEYALGSEPTLSNGSAAPHSSVANGNLTITFTRNTTATDVVMSVWGTDDLVSGTWEEIARSSGGSAFTDVLDGIPTGAPVSESGDGAIRSVQVGDVFQLGDPAHPKRFLKLKAEH
jgi:autotransporter-associated beta strand protein